MLLYRNVFRFVFAHWSRQRFRASAICLAMIAATAAEVFGPFYAGRLVDAVAVHAGWTVALRSLLVMGGLGLLMVAARFYTYWALVPFTLRMMRAAEADAFWRVQRFSADWHANSFAGSVVRQILRGAGAIDLLNDTLILMLLPAVVVLVGATAVLGAQFPLVGLAVAVGATVYAGLTVGMSVWWLTPAARLSNACDTRVGGALADALGGHAAVAAYGAEDREDRRFGQVLDKWSRRTARLWSRGSLSYSVLGIALLLLQMMVLGATLWMWRRGMAGPGDVTQVLATYFVIHGYLGNLGQSVRNLQRSVNEMVEMVGLGDQAFGIADRAGAPALRVGAGRIEFRDVRFRYGRHENPLFEQLNVIVAAGERVGLVGRSGSGKSTFVRLIQRLHDVTGGAIRIDGQNVAEVSQQSLRAAIAIVPQEPILFHRTLAENIAYGRPGASAAQIERAAREANAHDFIALLPKGYRTLVGERGVKLSGGERQRVAIARAFLADAPILILDEATSSLDSESEAAIQEAMERLMVGRTAIVIAHRLSTVRAMDRILVFSAGRIVEEGRHEALVRREGGVYRRLFERQKEGADPLKMDFKGHAL